MKYSPRHLCKLLLVAILGSVLLATVWARAGDQLRVATFRCDITPAVGQPMISGDMIRTVEQPLLAKGIVLEAGGHRYVLCALDWCQLGNGSYESVRSMIAGAAGAEICHVAVQTVHQHTAPAVDIDAQKFLAEFGDAKLHLDPSDLDEIEQRLATAVKQSLQRLEPFNQIGTGQAKVDRVASSRRPVDANGKVHPRMSLCTNAAVRALPEGKIDPYVKTITLARDGRPLVRMHYYATHPQTRYRDGRASSDMVGDAREALEVKEGVFQIYFTGCSGDITVGKYNDGSRKCRVELAGRLLAGMEAAASATKLRPAGPVHWRTYPLSLSLRMDRGYRLSDCFAGLKNSKMSAGDVWKCAVRVASLQRSERPIEVSCLEIGNVHVVHLPGEPMIDFQFFAQSLKPTDFVAVAGYGDYAPGYICPESAFRVGGYEPTASNVKPEFEAQLKQAIIALLGIDRTSENGTSHLSSPAGDCCPGERQYEGDSR